MSFSEPPHYKTCTFQSRQQSRTEKHYALHHFHHSLFENRASKSEGQGKLNTFSKVC